MATGNQAPSEAKALEILNKHRDRLLAIPNVTSCGIGRRMRAGRPTGDLCIQCTVETKLTPEQLRDVGIEMLPAQIEEAGETLDVDVIQRTFVPHFQVDVERATAATIDSEPQRSGDLPRRERLDPIAPGCSIANVKVTAGTFAAVVFDQRTGKPLVLSNWHVLNGPSGQIGDPIVQPGPRDDGHVDGNEIGRLLRSHLGLEGDCAVATLEGRAFDPTVIELNVVPRRTAVVNLGDHVVKSGRTTGVTYGIVTRVGVTARIDYRGQVGPQTIGCFEIGPNPAKPAVDGEVSEGGDSGSLWMIDSDDGDRDVSVGLHFAGETDPDPAAEHALACPIGAVLETLNVSLVRPEMPTDDEGEAPTGLVRRLELLERTVFGHPISEGGNAQLDQAIEEINHFSEEDLATMSSALEANESNRTEVRAGVEAGGWNIVWGVTINEAEYAKFIAACAVAVSTGDVGAVATYFQDYLNRSIDKFQREAPGVARDALVRTVLKALKDRGQTFRVGRIGVKGGIATYRRWYTVTVQVPDGMERYKIRGPFGSWTWGYRPKFKSVTNKVPLPNHHQPYVGFRLY